MANYELRYWRMRAHKVFDPLWQDGGYFKSRSQAYKWLRDVMDVPPKKAHIAMFDEDQCSLLLDAVYNLLLDS